MIVRRLRRRGDLCCCMLLLLRVVASRRAASLEPQLSKYLFVRLLATAVDLAPRAATCLLLRVSQG